MPKPKLKPLNGAKTHPLSDHAKEMLRRIADAPIPRAEVNPGVVNRLLRDSLVEVVMLPSPYKTHGGRLIEYLKIVYAGRVAVA